MDASTHSGYADYEWAIMLNRACLKLIGIWPDINENKQKKFLLDIQLIIILIVMTCSCAIPTIHSFIRIWGDYMSMVDNLLYTLPFLMAILKVLIIWRRKTKLIPLISMIEEDWLKFKVQKERDVMIKRAQIARIITICGYIVVLLTVIFSVILPCFGIFTRCITNITDPGKPMPMQTYYIYDTNKSPLYEITFFLQCISLMTAGIIYTGVDNLLGLLVFHVCGQLENLRIRILLLDKNNFDRNLPHNVQDHKRLLNSIKIIDDTFTMMLLGLLISFGLLFTVQGFLIITVIVRQDYGLSVSRFALIASAFITIFTHMCLYCVIGEMLVIQYNGIYNATCEFKWYNLKSKSARSLLILLVRVNKPLYLTAGKLFPMTLSTLCNLLKTSGGYISFLLHIVNKTEI